MAINNEEFLLGCDTMQSGRWVLPSWKNVICLQDRRYDKHGGGGSGIGRLRMRLWVKQQKSEVKLAIILTANTGKINHRKETMVRKGG
jgi:hypothetical protein